MLYIKSLVFTYLITGGFYLLILFFQLPLTQHSVSDNRKSYLFFYELPFLVYVIFFSYSIYK